MTDSFGGVVVSGGGKVLLREPTNHFGGYVWTFAKGAAQNGESPPEAALREVQEETGYRCRILADLPGAFAGSTGTTRFYLMDAQHPPAETCDETSNLRWVDFEQARTLLGQAKIKAGRQRDLAVLAAAQRVLADIPHPSHPNVQPEDYWAELFPMSEEQISVRLDRGFEAAAMEQIRRGFFPTSRAQRWFIHFSGTQLRFYRSWTGLFAMAVNFELDPRGGGRIAEVLLNSDPVEVGVPDEAEALKELNAAIDTLLLNRPDQAPSSRAPAFLDSGPPLSDLGDPAVVTAALAPIFVVALKILRGEAAYEDGAEAHRSVASIFSADQPGYQRRPAWHTQAALGQALLQQMSLDPATCEGRDLHFLVSEALAGLHLKIRELLQDFESDPHAHWNPDGLRQLHALHEFTTSVFLGIGAQKYPGKALGDIAWERVASGEG